MKKAILILFVLLSAAGIRAQIRSVECTAPRPGLYERTDFTIRLTARYDNAYLQEQVALDMLITTPSGAERMLPCYWVEGGVGCRVALGSPFHASGRGTLCLPLPPERTGP